ncbi:MAG: helix-turn-helix domain-containing protein [Pirellulales bacterium]
MENSHFAPLPLAEMLDGSTRPIYAIDARRQLIYCNAALAAWLGLSREQIVGRYVEYHSEPAEDIGPRAGARAALTDLCPPPQAIAGTPSKGTIGCVGRDGRLVHRRAEFIPLGAAGQTVDGVLVLLSADDLSPQELTFGASDDPSADELHRAIRTFRRQQASHYALESLLGESDAIRRIRAQVAAAAASQAHVLVRGRRGTGREHIGRAIHYHAKDAAGKLVPIDCPVATEESLRRAVELLRGPRDPKQRHTLLLLHVEQLPAPLQSQLVGLAASGALAARLVATLEDVEFDPRTMDEAPRPVNPQLLSLLSTITIDVPTLAERLADLPVLAQFFLEAANRGSTKQLGSLRAEVLDQLALYSWPRGLDELRQVIVAAHAAATTHEITVADLPALVHHAAQAAALPRKTPKKIDLVEFLESIERELITRALQQAGGNKSAAAELLGMPRPRLYRRLVQLGLIAEPAQAVEELPS